MSHNILLYVNIHHSNNHRSNNASLFPMQKFPMHSLFRVLYKRWKIILSYYYRLTTELSETSRPTSSQNQPSSYTLSGHHRYHVIACVSSNFDDIRRLCMALNIVIQQPLDVKRFTSVLRCNTRSFLIICVCLHVNHNRAPRVHFSTGLSPEAEATALSMTEAVASGLIVIKWFAIPSRRLKRQRSGVF